MPIVEETENANGNVAEKAVETEFGYMNTGSKGFENEINNSFTIDREYTPMLENDVVVYFLFDKSNSVDPYINGINITVDFVDSLVSELSELIQSYKEKESYISVGAASFSKNLDEKIPITTIGEDDIENERLREIKNDLNSGETNYIDALETVISKVENFDSENNTTKIIVLFSDFQNTSKEIIQYVFNNYENVKYETVQYEDKDVLYLSFMLGNNKYGLLFGAYSNQNIISLDKNLNYFEIANQDVWVNQLLRIFQAENQNSFGWIRENESRTILINDCMVNKLFSTNDNNDGSIRLINEFDEVKNEGIINSQKTGGIIDYELIANDTNGFYFIRSYRPDFTMELSYEPIIVYSNEDTATELNLHLVSHDTKIDPATYSVCINPQLDGVTDPELTNVTTVGVDYSWTIPAMSSTCENEISKTLLLKNIQNGQHNIWEKDISVPLYYRSSVDIPIVHSTESEEFLQMDEILINVFHFPNSSPNLYLLREKEYSCYASETESLQNCPVSNGDYENYEYLEISNVLLQNVKNESDPDIFAGYSVNKTNECISSYTIETFNFVVDENSCGYSKLAIVWDDNERNQNISDVICDFQNNNLDEEKCVFLGVEGEMNFDE